MTKLSISNSEIQTFKHCRRQWWLSYYRALRKKRKVQQGPLALGTRVHVSLEALYDKDMVDAGVSPIDVYNDFFERDRALFFETEEAYSGYPPSEDQIKKFDSEGALGRIMVEGYVEWLAETGEDQLYEVIGAEQKIEVPFMNFDDFEVWLIGKLDVRIRRKTDGARLFVDHKTCQSIEQLMNTMRLNEQFIHYQLLEKLDADARGEPWTMTQGSMVNALRKVKRTAQAKPPFYHREEVHHSIVELRNYYLRLVGEVEDIVSVRRRLNGGVNPLKIAYPSPTRDCSWRCEFRDACPMFDDGSDVERFLSDHFEGYDPHDRYADDKEGDNHE